MAANQRKFLIFFMHGRSYAFDLEHIAEVSDPVTSWSIPLAPACYSGAINFHGAIVAVMDLALFLGLGYTPEFEKIIVLDVKIASLGFMVERVSRIVSEQDIEHKEGPDSCFVSAVLILPEGNATLLDLDAIIVEAGNTING